jgi:hypothetical protein
VEERYDSPTGERKGGLAMTVSKAGAAFLLAFLSAALFGCGGGGGGGGGSDIAVNPPPGGAGDTTVPPGEYVVVRYDQDADGNPDLLTLDKTETPFTVVEALAGTDDGGSVVVTEKLGGRPIDPAISDALASYLAESLEVASETDLEVVDSSGSEISITVFE